MIKQIRSASILLAVLVLAAAIPRAEAQTYVWDGSTTSGYQNTNGTWGTDNFWTTNSGANSGTVLNAWSNNATAWLGGNASVAGSPTGNFTITVSGTQVATIIRQIQNGAGNFTLEGGELQANGFRADTNTLTINSVIGSYTNAANARVDFSAQPVGGAGTLLILGGNNTLTNAIGIAGASSGGGTVRLNHQNALGLGNSVTWTHNTILDLNGYSISGKDITVANTRTVLLLNGGVSNAVWSGNVLLTNTTAVGFRAGGTNGAEVEISGIISGGSGNSVQSQDNGTLRLSGANTYDGQTSVRGNSTLVVGNASALGSTTSGTFISTGATLDLNGFNVGNEAITLQQSTGRLVNSNTSAAATVAGNITNSQSTSVIGGPGNLTLSGSLSSGVASGFSKTGTGTVTLSGGTANTLSGTVTVGEGTLKLDKTAGVNAIAGNLIISNSAVLLVAQSDQVNNSSAVTLSGGTIQRGSGVSEVFGNLNLTTGSFLDFGTGSTGTLSFGTYTPSALLTVDNFFQGNVLTFRSDLSGSINNTNSFRFDNAFTSSWDSGSTTFTITAIPEPSTYLAAAGLLAVLMWPSRRRLLKDAKSVLGLRPPMRDRLSPAANPRSRTAASRV
jgi:autotransporter-associated beta strand protein